ncbi:hypothetical protein Fmac_032218 [Flemingia macrophylla]|uniref:TH1 domain-containing protein n=1 Tax=Flemingia macrophylla TaxID=520843 RepID=A0ABD1L4A6_9FABA
MPRRVQIEDPKYDEEAPEETLRFKSSSSNVSDDQEPFMGMKVRRKASLHRDCKGDYVNVPSHPFLINILRKQGDNQVLFADSLFRFTASGKIKRCVLIITHSALYVVDPDVDALKRRVALPAVERVCLSELSDNFFAIVIPSEYDLLMASTRKTEIVTLLVEATKSKTASGFELHVVFSNRFEYNAASDLVKEVQFEEVEGFPLKTGSINISKLVEETSSRTSYFPLFGSVLPPDSSKSSFIIDVPYFGSVAYKSFILVGKPIEELVCQAT